MGRSNARNHRNGGYYKNNQNNKYNNNNKYNSNNNNNNNRNKNNTKQECTLCGSTRHQQNQCIATGEEKQAYSTYKVMGKHGPCIHCNKEGSHLPSNCFKRQKNSSNSTGNWLCEFCKKKTNHRLTDCSELRKWIERANRTIDAAFKAVPYCLSCGGAHQWSECTYSRKEQRKTDFQTLGKALLFEWLSLPSDTDASVHDLSFCGYCEKFCDHNTATCTESVEQYRANKRNFLLVRFGEVLEADESDRLGQKPMRPLVERKCQLCHTVLPKAKKLQGHPDHNIIVHCTNPRCGSQTVLSVDDGEDGRSSSSSNTWGRKNSFWSDPNNTAREHVTRALGYVKEDYWPFFAGHAVTSTAKGQPYYDGDPMRTALACLRPSEYHNEGLWTFNDPGNFQPFFPPALCQFTLHDIDASNESNIPIKHTRTGLTPFCSGCGLFGAVVDDDYDVVMTQSGSDMEGNLAGAGAGVVIFENPLYRLGGRNGPGETHYIARGQCLCTIKRGAEPNIVWAKERCTALSLPV